MAGQGAEHTHSTMAFKNMKQAQNSDIRVRRGTVREEHERSRFIYKADGSGTAELEQKLSSKSVHQLYRIKLGSLAGVCVIVFCEMCIEESDRVVAAKEITSQEKGRDEGGAEEQQALDEAVAAGIQKNQFLQRILKTSQQIEPASISQISIRNAHPDRRSVLN